MSSYKTAGVHIVHQNIAGEVIVVDLEKGSYFSLLESAVFIWEGLVGGCSDEQLLNEMTTLFEAETSQLERNFNSFIQRLRDEGLIVEISQTAEATAERTRKTPDVKLPFVAPEIHKYDDMAEVLALDPIHDFDEAGWPSQPVAAQ